MSQARTFSTGLFARLPAKLKLTRAASTVVESLEVRRLMCMDHDHDEVMSAPPVATPAVIKAAKTNKVRDHGATYYKPARKVTLSRTVIQAAVNAGGMSNAVVADPVSFSTNSAGLPLLTSRADGQGLKIFLDFDGYVDSSVNDAPFSLDSDLNNFNATEQATIYGTWRDIVSSFSMLNVNVTTVQPPTGGNNTGFVWQRITNTEQGGAAYVGWIVNDASHGFNNSDNAVSRHSGIAHEIGHQLSLDHQSDYDTNGTKTGEYTGGIDTLHGPIMGVDYNGNVKKFYFGRDTNGADSFQDDLSDMAGMVTRVTGLNGYKPDDFTGTGIGTAASLTTTNGSFQTAGTIETMNDADWFSFTSTGGRFNINVEPTYASALAPKLEVYTSTGTLLGSIDDTLLRYAQDNGSEQLNLTLGSGTYYAKVSSHGDYGDLGEYAFYASPLPGGWTSVDVNPGNTGRGGYATYDSNTGTFFQGGSGADIWNTSDAFRYSYQTLTGDGSITARVDRLDNTAAYAKAGLMIRQSTAANSAHVFVGVRPSGELDTIRRTGTGTGAVNIANTAGQNGPWLRLTRVGNNFTLSRSADGATWITVGTTTVSMTGPVLIGLATTSNNFGAMTTSSFSNVSVTGTLGTTPPATNGLTAPAGLTAVAVAAQNTGLTLNWADVTGETGYSIERSLDNVNFSGVGTVGANVTTYTDSPTFGAMRYWYRVTALSAGGMSAYSASASAINKPIAPFGAQVVKINANKLSITWRDVAGDNGYRVERSTDGGSTYTTLGTTGANITGWNADNLVSGTTYTFRITPIGASGDGAPLVLTSTTQLPAPATIALGNLSASIARVSWSAVTGAATYNVYRSTDNITFTRISTVAGTVSSFIDNTVAPLTNYYYYVSAVTADGQVGARSATVKGSTAPAAALPTPWLDADIGNVTGTGDAGGSNGSFTINSSGSDIANPDAFHFVYQPITGDTTIVAQVTSLSVSDAAAKAGLMIRQNVTSDTAAYAGIFMNAGNGYGIDVRSRSTAGANYSYGQVIGNVAAPYYLKLVRSGSTISFSYSADGVNYTSAGSRTVAMTGTVYVGLASTAFSTTLMNAATFANVKIASAAPTVATAAAATPNPVTGKTTSLSVLGADDGGETNLNYVWTATGPGAVTFSANNSNAAKNSVATFTKAGTYTFTATISDGGFNTTTSSVTVVVSQTLGGITATTGTMLAGFTQQITAADQFGNPMTVGGIAWSASAGSISQSGVYTAPAIGTNTATITGVVGGSTYTTTVAITAPRAWYKADGIAGGTLVDASGNNYSATLVDGYTADTAGQVGSAVNFTGGYANTPAGVINGLTDFTISTWVKPTATLNWNRAFDFGTGTNAYVMLAPSDGNGFVRFSITNSGGGNNEQIVTTNIRLTNNVWTHLAVTLVGNTATVYVNGAVAGTNTNVTLNPAMLGTLTQNYIGKSQYSADPNFRGSIDDFRVYDRGVTAADISGLYAAGVAARTDAPTNVTAVATSAANVNVAWTDASSNEVGYLVERSTNAAFTAGVSSVTLAAGTSAYADTTVAAGTTYYYRVTTLLAGGTTAGPTNAAAVTTPTVAVAPQVSDFRVNDGTAQRSRVTSLTLTFSAPVSMSPGAVTLWRRTSASATAVQVSGFVLTQSADGTTFTLGFPAGSTFDAAGLSDGLYELRISGANVTASGTPMTADTSFSFYRLFGDANGDRTVDFNDFLAFQNSFGSTTGSAAFATGLDGNNDGLIDFNDFLQFQNQFGKAL